MDLKAASSTPNQVLPPTAGRARNAVIRVYDEAGNVIKTHEHKGDSKSGEHYTRVKQKAAMR